MINKRFGLLTILKEARCEGKDRSFYCVCDCGRKTIVRLRSLRSGNTRSCGCLQKRRAAEASRTHGLKGTKKQHPLYLVWRGIKTRCFNPRCKAFKTYGARGISIASEWKDDPEAFVMWAIRHGWNSKLTIHRINNDGDYEPLNCEFISKSENSKRKNAQERFQKRALHVVMALSLPV